MRGAMLLSRGDEDPGKIFEKLPYVPKTHYGTVMENVFEDLFLGFRVPERAPG
jgi:hypothetical protein